MNGQFIINGKSIHNIASFYEAINRVFMADEDWQLGASLDAFDDLLSGGFGALKAYETAQLVWLDMPFSRAALGYEATKAYYEEKLLPGSPFNKELFATKLAALENGTGETYFDTLMTIINDHSNITLVAA